MAIPLRKLLGALGAGVLAGAATAAAVATPFELRPGGGAWAVLVRGTGDGMVRARVIVLLPGLDRRDGATLWIEVESATALTVAVDERPAEPVVLRAGMPAAVAIPPSRVPGARVALAPAAGAGAAHLRAIRVESRGPRWKRGAVWAFGATTLLALGSFALRLPGAAALALCAAGLVTAAFVPARLIAAMPGPGAAARIAPAIALIAAGLIAGLRAERRRFLADAALLAALVFGAAVRLWLLPSAGSWDTEYWKAWTHQAVSHGVAHVYGDREAVPDGHFLAQLEGREPSWQAPYRGREFGIDYPPLAMEAWRASAALVALLGGGLDPAEAENVAVKLPALVGDIASVLFLLWALRAMPRRAAAIAALYWALPVSWLNSAAQGFMDAAYAPLLGAALVLAGRGRAAAAGVLLACAGLVKPTAIVVVPAVAVALWPVARGWLKAAAGGLAVGLVVLAPFALARTLDTLVVHVGRVFLQERLSGGYANGWWLVAEAARAARDGIEAWATAGPFQRLEAVALPARPIGGVLLLAAAAWILWCLSRARGPRAAALAGGALVFAYGMVAVGVHENHPHPMFLLWCAAGLASARLRVIAAGTAITYVLNILMLSGLGRFHTTRHLALEPWLASLAGLRLAPGFDGMLLLAGVNVLLFVWMMTGLPGMAEGEGFEPPKAFTRELSRLLPYR